jgi:hypothetical protein
MRVRVNEGERASASKRPRTSEKPEASESSESTTEVRPEGADWSFRGKLAKIGGDLRGNPFKAVVDLVDHENLHLTNQDDSARGMAEEMLTLQLLVSASSL